MTSWPAEAVPNHASGGVFVHFDVVTEAQLKSLRPEEVSVGDTLKRRPL